jgi:hypothetical protein
MLENIQLIWHVNPANIFGHVHPKPFPEAKHVPPFQHGFGKQMFISFKTNMLFNNTRHVQAL